MLVKSGFKIFTRYQTKKLLIWAYWTKNFIRIFFLALDELSCFLTEIQINIFLFFCGRCDFRRQRNVECVRKVFKLPCERYRYQSVNGLRCPVLQTYARSELFLVLKEMLSDMVLSG